jgi:murein DD-endopeptidase MepM/ murein hydrolase activator NlpD
MIRLFATLFLLLNAVPSWAFDVEFRPSTVAPGDPFVITVHSNPVRPSATFNGLEMAFSECGRGCYVALGAAGLETGPGEYPLAVTAGGEVKTLSLKVIEKTFSSQRLTLPEDQVILSAEDKARAEREAIMFRAIWNTVTVERHWDGNFIMPLDNDLSANFGIRRFMNGKPKSRHRGVDIRGRAGEHVLAANSGRVALVGDTFFGGNTIVIDHGLGLYTIYMHLSKSNVVSDEYITKGDVVGFVGSSGRSTGPHLHFGIKMNSNNVNPVSMSRLPLPAESPFFISN